MRLSLERFQKWKKRYTRKNWIVVNEKNTHLIIKEWISSDENEHYHIKWLETETHAFLKEEPTLKDAAMAALYLENGDFEQIELEFGLKNGETVTFTAHMEGLLGSGEIETEFHFPYDSKSSFELEEDVKNEMRNVYKTFKKIIAESPLYRLHFVTKEIKFEEDYFNRLK